MMELSNIYESIKFIQPEIAAAISLIVIVMYDLIFAENKKLLPYISIVGVLITLLFTINQFGLSNSAFFTSHSNKVGMISVDPFGAFFKVIILLGSLIVIVFSMFSKEIQSIVDRQGEYYSLLFGMILGMLLLISASDFVLIYLSLELLSLSSYVLSGITKLRDRNSEAALKYIIYGGVSSGLMLFGISILFGLTGNTNLYDINCAIQGLNISPVVLAFSIILILAGFGYKISAVPFHFWTPDVYEGAPITITAYLSVASKAAGFAVLMRFIKTAFSLFLDDKGGWHLSLIFDWQLTLIVISIATMTVGNLTALWQTNLKRLLAYSSIAHAGYMLLGVAALSNQGVSAVMVYFTYYLIMNLGAFFVIMVIADKTGRENLDEIKGIGKKIPFLGATLVIFLMSLVGLPPTAGFIGKFYLFIAVLDAKLYIAAIIAVVNSVISLYYYFRIVKNMYLDSSEEEIDVQGIETLKTKLIALVLVVPTIVFGLYWSGIGEIVNKSFNIFG